MVERSCAVARVIDINKIFIAQDQAQRRGTVPWGLFCPLALALAPARGLLRTQKDYGEIRIYLYSTVPCTVRVGVGIALRTGVGAEARGGQGIGIFLWVTDDTHTAQVLGTIQIPIQKV